MSEDMFTSYIKSYVDNGIDIPNYINTLVDKMNLNPIKIYGIGISYLRKGLVEYAEPILKAVGVSINNA